MFGLTLDIDYVVASLVILIVLYIFSKKKYSMVTNANRIFYYMVLCAIATCVFDILMNIAITYSDFFPEPIYMLFRLLFNGGTSAIAYLGYKYAGMYLEGKDTKLIKCLNAVTLFIFVSYLILSGVNMFTGIIAYIDDNGVYQHGPLFLLNTIAPALIFLMVLILLLTNITEYSKTQRNSIIIYFLLTFIFVGIELATNNVAPTTMFGVAISLIVIQQSLVSPEYVSLEKALYEQKKISEEASEARADALVAKVAAEQANNAKSSFLARMSHEIRTPLNAVINFNSMISNATQDSTIKNYSDDAKAAGENLLSLINDILDFSKIENGKMELIEDNYSLRKLIYEEYILFSLKASQAGLTLIFDIDEQLPSKLFGDELRIKQILTNLLSNAIKYTREGSVTFKVSLEKTDSENAYIKFEVQDTGIGIKEEDLDKLFEAFERIEEQRNRSIEGTGLGVNICISLLAMMNSKLNVTSVYGLGSNFNFVLAQPIRDAAPIGDFNTKEITKKSEEHVFDPSAIPAAKLLVVDDAPLNLKVFTNLLKNTKLDIDCAGSGKEALELTLKQKYDLILMDHMMPEMDGIEAMVTIKHQENGLNQDTNIIALTANAVKGAYEEYTGLGFTDALFKPIMPNSLYETLLKYLTQ